MPRYEQAVIPISKLTKYALSPQSSPNKAKAFELALGYTADNAHELLKNILDNLHLHKATPKGDKGFGNTYEVRMKLTGPNGKKATVLTAWIDDAETGEVRLITLYVD